MAASRGEFLQRGWTRLPERADVAAWASAARELALALIRAPDAEFRCAGAWFPGVNILPNDAHGGAPALGLPRLPEAALEFVRDAAGFVADSLDRAQISACFPGYPRHGAEESEAAFRYRRDRDAAHVDGLMRQKPGRRRRLGESHGFILGLPLTLSAPEASPFVVWEGSHEDMRAAFRRAFDGVPPGRWAEIDVTEIYQEARRKVFAERRRVEIQARPGECVLTHRLALHGVAPWRAPETDGPRIIAYFRPDPFPGAPPDWWLERP